MMSQLNKILVISRHGDKLRQIFILETDDLNPGSRWYRHHLDCNHTCFTMRVTNMRCCSYVPMRDIIFFRIRRNIYNYCLCIHLLIGVHITSTNKKLRSEISYILPLIPHHHLPISIASPILLVFELKKIIRHFKNTLVHTKNPEGNIQRRVAINSSKSKHIFLSSIWR